MFFKETLVPVREGVQSDCSIRVFKIDLKLSIRNNNGHEMIGMCYLEKPNLV